MMKKKKKKKVIVHKHIILWGTLEQQSLMSTFSFKSKSSTFGRANILYMLNSQLLKLKYTLSVFIFPMQIGVDF